MWVSKRQLYWQEVLLKLCFHPLDLPLTCSEALAKGPWLPLQPSILPAHLSHALLQPQGLLAFPGTPQTVSHPRVPASHLAPWLLSPAPSEQPQDHSRENALLFLSPCPLLYLHPTFTADLMLTSVVRAGCQLQEGQNLGLFTVLHPTPRTVL